MNPNAEPREPRTSTLSAVSPRESSPKVARLSLSPRQSKTSATAVSPLTSPRISLVRQGSTSRQSANLVTDVHTTDVLYTTNVSQLCLARHVPSGGRASVGGSSHNHDDDDDDDDDDEEAEGSSSNISKVVTVKQYSLSLAAAAGPGMQAAVMRERQVMKALVSPMPFIPAHLGWARDDKYLTVVINTRALCTLDNLVVSGGPLTSPAAVQYYAATMALALEHLHMYGVVYRGTYPETLLLDEDGRLQLTDFRFSKVLLDGRTHTLCGAPEYLAPEVVAGVGHNQAADWWSLGVLVYYLYVGQTPFMYREDFEPGTPAHWTGAPKESHRQSRLSTSAEEVQDEKDIYKRITDHAYAFPDQVPDLARQLISELLVADPNQRLGYGTGGMAGLRSHPFFAGTDWEALVAPDVDSPLLVPEEMMERIGSLRPTAVEPLEGAVAFTGDVDWCKDF